jgi:PAS domain S-box-containing protein
MTIPSQDLLNARILIVDDQQANVNLLEAMLQAAGFTQVSSTQDPTTVCALHRQHAFDLILLDLQMPVMDGFQVMEGLKASAPDDYLPVLVITAQPGHKLRALQAGAKDFVSKPFDMVEVKTRIHNLIEVRLLYRQLALHNQALERQVQQRTTELRESEARYRALTELATDWHWEQDGEGRFTQVSGPVLEMLGLRVDALSGAPGEDPDASWTAIGRREVQARIASRSPFLDVPLSRTLANGVTQHYRVSGTPVFDSRCNLTGYRGFGVAILPPLAG